MIVLLTETTPDSSGIRARILYPDLGLNLDPRLKFRTFEIRIQFHNSDLNLGLSHVVDWT